ncbi:GntR family transcriptional regulator [Novosphingobium flavum]|uniref:GntR family transcriptional regulator n=1 Tax=Novosphingobium flavum TaxID=1778672 RepID=A0A7X1FS72_9SPHN|nr:GntR family transcriptional regulator [Novosphingobium flavum]MBC2665874.1 GntR family transcriptional regulator [Novosphingobium flavum]
MNVAQSAALSGSETAEPGVSGTEVNKKQKPLSRTAVVDAIRQRILRGDLVPGQRLVEAELCELLNASRGTVRTALMDLDHEGLVERIANRGARVRVVGLEEALQIVEVRMAVEVLCVSRAAQKITDKQITELRKLGAQLEEKASQSDVDRFAELTHKVFETYVKIADQPVAEEVLARLRARNTRHRFRLTYRAGRAQVSLPYWLDLIEAICNRDPVAARAALRRQAQNIEASMKALAHEDSPFAIIYPNT